jgi:hypothetical protein
MALEFKGGSRNTGHNVNLGIAHGTKQIAGQQYDGAAAEALLANFARKEGFGDLRNVSVADRELLLEVINDDRRKLEEAGLPALPKLIDK